MKKPLYLDGVDRMNKLRAICPDFDRTCALMKFGTFRAEKPDLSVACSAFCATYCGEVENILHELANFNYTFSNISDVNMHNVCCYLIDFFSVSGEIECGAAVLRWMHDNCDFCTPAEGEVLRL